MNRLPDDLIYNVATFLDYSDYYSYRSTTRDKKHHKPYDIVRAIWASAAGVIKSAIADDYLIDLHDMILIISNPELRELHVLMYGAMNAVKQNSANRLFIQSCDVTTVQQLVHDGTWTGNNSDFYQIISYAAPDRRMAMLDTIRPHISTRLLGLPLDVFEWVIKNGEVPCALDMYITVDRASDYLAVLYRYRRDLFMKCTFEPMDYPIDEDMMSILIEMYAILDPKLKHEFRQDLSAYHEWLWRNGPLTTPRALDIIKYIDRTAELHINSDRRHMMYAVASPWKEYAQYLVLSGVSVTRADYTIAAKYNTIVSQYLYDIYTDTYITYALVFASIILLVIYMIPSVKIHDRRPRLRFKN